MSPFDDRRRTMMGAILIVSGIVNATMLVRGLSCAGIMMSAALVVGGVLVLVAARRGEELVESVSRLTRGGDPIAEMLAPLGTEAQLLSICKAAQICATPASRVLRLTVKPSDVDPVKLLDFELRAEPEDTLSGRGAPELKRVIETFGIARARANLAPVRIDFVGEHHDDGTWGWSWSEVEVLPLPV